MGSCAAGKSTIIRSQKLRNNSHQDSKVGNAKVVSNLGDQGIIDLQLSPEKPPKNPHEGSMEQSIPETLKKQTNQTCEHTNDEGIQVMNPEKSENENEEDDGMDLRGTVVDSLVFERQISEAKREAEELGELALEPERQERKWKRHVAGLSVISEASQYKEVSGVWSPLKQAHTDPQLNSPEQKFPSKVLKTRSVTMDR